VKAGDVQKALETLAKEDGVPGVIGEAYVDGRRVGKGSAGSRLIGGKGGEIPSDARYRIGSQTKSMTGVVILQLVDEGRLELTTPRRNAGPADSSLKAISATSPE
jgi:D-alanyl-D-alanine carboxypeptidase